MKRSTLSLLALVFTPTAFAGGVDMESFSQAVVKTAAQFAAMRPICGDDLGTVTESDPSDGIHQYHLVVAQRGIGRLGGHIFRSCDVTITVNWLRARGDGPVMYSAKYKERELTEEQQKFIQSFGR